MWLDRLAAGILAPLAMWVLASGLDDLFLDFCFLYCSSLTRRSGWNPCPGFSQSLPEKKIAIIIPTWREDDVIEHMIEHNLCAMQYSNYEIFVGVYPNDMKTIHCVLAVERKHPRVHHVLCPHDGPTSKADCLNWVYQGILAHEEEIGNRFDIILQHDAEDVIHPRSLRWINAFSEHYDMVQVPVLPLATPWWEFTHGAYCDDFAQSHLKELHLRQQLGGFLPSCGVGTAYRRRALERLAWNSGNRLFEPTSLTEDYRIGLDLHRLGCSQILLDAKRLAEGGDLAATREFFPRSFRSAVRQRARWVMGIALQSWQEIGWNAGGGQFYWLWRDRKGLLGNPVTILANIVFLYGAARWLWAHETSARWFVSEAVAERPWLGWLLLVNAALLAVRLIFRAGCVLPAYGWRHALVCPLRSVWGNLINFAACMRALRLFAVARLRNQVPEWMKTDHCYPNRRVARKKLLGEVLLELKMAQPADIAEALRVLRPGERLGEHLVRQGLLSESMLYAALSIQHDVPFQPVDPSLLTPEASERLPFNCAREMGVIPTRVVKRRLWVAGPEIPTAQLSRSIQEISRLEPQFQLVTPSNYCVLCNYLEKRHYKR